MELEFTGEQEELRSSVRSFLEKECPIDLVRAVVETGEPPEKLWGSMVALDWPALAIPEEYGGVGLSIVEWPSCRGARPRRRPGPLLPTVTRSPLWSARSGRRATSTLLVGGRLRRDRRDGRPQRRSAGMVGRPGLHDRGACGRGWVLDGTKLAVVAPEGVSELAVVAKAGGGIGAFVVPVGWRRWYRFTRSTQVGPSPPSGSTG